MTKQRSALIIEGSSLIIDMLEVSRSLSPEQRQELASVLSMDEYLIQHVVCALTTGILQSADGQLTMSLDPQTLERLRMTLLPMMSDISSGTITSLVADRDLLTASLHACSAWAWDMWRGWPKEFANTRINPPSEVMAGSKYSGAEIEQVEVMFFKPNGKWYTDERVYWPAELSKHRQLHPLFAEVLKEHLTYPKGHEREGTMRLSEMIAICPQPYHEYSHPISMRVSAIPRILRTEKMTLDELRADKVAYPEEHAGVWEAL